MNKVKNLHKLQLPKKLSKMGKQPGNMPKEPTPKDKEMKSGIKPSVSSKYVTRVDRSRLPPSEMEPAGGLVATRELVKKTEDKKTKEIKKEHTSK